MSKNEYVFHATHKKPAVIPPIQTSQGILPVGDSRSIKQIILEQYDHLTEMKIHNERFRYLSEARDQISQQITQSFAMLQQTGDKATQLVLNEKLNHLSDLHKKLTQESDVMIQSELNVLFTGWPDIFEKVKEGIDRETLSHVLTMFEEYQSGKISDTEAVSHGMDYMTTKYHLPSDFFNKDGIPTFNKKLREQKK